MGMDPVKVKEMNMPVEGGPLPGYPDVLMHRAVPWTAVWRAPKR